MKLELGAPVVLVHLESGLGTGLYHLADELVWPDGFAVEPQQTLCGLTGNVHAYAGPIRRLRACGICRRRAGRQLLAPPDWLEAA